MERTTLAIDDIIFVLAADQDIDDLKERVVAAAQSGPAFVDFSTTGGRVSALIGGRTRVAIATETHLQADHSLAGPLQLTPDGFFPYDESLEDWARDSDGGRWRG